MTSIKIVSYTQSVYCECGATARFTGSDLRAALKLFAKDHQGTGHAPMTAAEFHKRKKRIQARQEIKQQPGLI